MGTKVTHTKRKTPRTKRIENGVGRKKFPGICQAICRLFKKNFYPECFTEEFKIEKKWAVDGCQFKIH